MKSYTVMESSAADNFQSGQVLYNRDYLKATYPPHYAEARRVFGGNCDASVRYMSKNEAQAYVDAHKGGAHSFMQYHVVRVCDYLQWRYSWLAELDRREAIRAEHFVHLGYRAA